MLAAALLGKPAVVPACPTSQQWHSLKFNSAMLFVPFRAIVAFGGERGRRSGRCSTENLDLLQPAHACQDRLAIEERFDADQFSLGAVFVGTSRHADDNAGVSAVDCHHLAVVNE